MAKKRNRISALMSETIAASSPLIKKSPTDLAVVSDDTIIEVSINKLVKNPYQPRMFMDTQALNELVTSIESNGLLQPIVVTKKDDSYIIIAGHRRVKAYEVIGKSTIKASVLTDIKEKDLAILSLTENLVRENLHPIENALSMKHILDQKIVESQNKLSSYLGLSKGHVSKMINILNLPSTLIEIIKNENYRDINVLVLINKISTEDNMLEAFTSIKNLSRSEAEKFIKNTYLNSSNINETTFCTVKSSKKKIDISIDIKALSVDKLKIVQDNINQISLLLDNTATYK